MQTKGGPALLAWSRDSGTDSLVTAAHAMFPGVGPANIPVWPDDIVASVVQAVKNQEVFKQDLYPEGPSFKYIGPGFDAKLYLMSEYIAQDIWYWQLATSRDIPLTSPPPPLLSKLVWITIQSWCLRH